MKIKTKTISLILIATLLLAVLIFFLAFPWRLIFFNQISIINDSDFKKYRFPGEGTVDNPYIIQGYELTNPKKEFTGKTGIHVSKTTKHFVIKNCILSFYYRAIKISEVKAGTCSIVNNTILEGGRSDSSPAAGIEVMESDDVYVCNNTIVSNYNHAITFFWSTNCTLEGNYISNYGDGITIFGSQYFYIANNYLVNNDVGITLWETNQSKIFSNFLSNERWNVHCSGYYQVAYYNEIENNTCINAKTGIYISDRCSYSYIFSNNITSNNEGIVIEGGYNLVYGNLIQNNTKDGIHLTTKSSNNIVYYNNIINNHPVLEVLKSQALDDGIQNTWFNIFSFQGNFWSNLGSNSTYQIAGTAGSADLYPLTIPI